MGCVASSGAALLAVVDAGDACAEGVEPQVDVLVSAVNLADVLNRRDAVGRHGGDEQRHAGADVGRGHARGPQPDAVVVADDRGAVRVAEDNLRPHVDELVDEEEAALEHLLVDEHGALGLGGHHEEYRKQVGGESRPRRVGDGHDGAVEEGVDAVVLLGGDVDVVAPLLEADAHAGELGGDDAQVVVGDVLDGELRLGHGGHADETAHLNHVGEHRVFGAAQRFDPLDGEQVGGDARDACAHAVEHAAELLDVGLAGGVVDARGAAGQHGGHDDVGRTGHRGLVEEHVGAAQFGPLDHKELVGDVEVELRAELLEAEEVGVEASAADFVTARFGDETLSEAAEHGADEHHRAAQPGAAVAVVLRAHVVEVEVGGAEGAALLREPLDAHAHAAEQLDELHHVDDAGYVVHDDPFGGEQRCAEYLQSLVLGALGGDFTVEAVSAFNLEYGHSLAIFR